MNDSMASELVLVVDQLAEERLVLAAVDAALSVSPAPSIEITGAPGGQVAVFFSFRGPLPISVRDRLHQAAHRLEGRLKEGRALFADERARLLALPETAQLAAPAAPALSAFFAALSKGAKAASGPASVRVDLDSEDDAWAAYVRHMAEGSLFIPTSQVPKPGERVQVRFHAPNLLPLEAEASVLEVKPDGFVAKLEFGQSYRTFIVRRGQARREGRPLPKPSPDAESRRQHARFASRLEVRFQSAPALSQAWTTNLSKGGLFVETDSPPPMNSVIELVLVLPEGKRVEIEGKVVHVLSPAQARQFGKRPGVGLAFDDVHGEMAARIEPLVQRYQSRKPRVLVVDDSDFFRKVLAAELTAAGFEVEMAADGQEAQAKLSAALWALDLMVLDLKMPGIDGRTLLKRIRQDREEADLKVLVLSGSSEEELKNLRSPEWADAALQKGIAMGDVVAEVKRLLGR